MYFREESSEYRIRTAVDNDRIDSKYGFERVRDTKERTGYLINMHTVSIPAYVGPAIQSFHSEFLIKMYIEVTDVDRLLLLLFFTSLFYLSN